MRKVLYAAAQCTWGIFQTIAGAIVFLIFIREKHHFYHGCIVTPWKLSTGVSLGLFIFTDPDGKLLEHEYSHTLQSLLLGPLYLPVISLPSLLWAGLPCFVKMRKSKHISYNSFFTEKWAEHIRSRLFTDKK
ncbi:MAG: hypothetical protein IJZ72_02815 [Oscillospiraceae bacterium]|nr:hypothetical protein [Oscillospiraceae bacterium]